jgi:hypothetical protein
VSALLVILNIVGWSLAALFLAAVILTRRTNRYWFNACEERDKTIAELERQRLIGVQANPDGLKWYRDENVRLARKCEAICRAARRAKGRGKVTVQMDPMHNF